MFWRNLSVIAALIGLLVWLSPQLFQRPTTTGLEIWMLDVGQGESVLVREPSGKLLLFDGGPDDSVLSQLGAVLPPWQHTINLVLLSHNHADHIRGLISVLKRFTVQQVWDSGSISLSSDFTTFQGEISQQKIQQTHVFFHQLPCSEICPRPTAFGEAFLQVYHPLEDSTGLRPENEHDTDVSIKVSWHNVSIFLAGDLDEQHEDDMIESCQLPTCTLHATILQIPHHGSATGLSPEFLAATSPKEAWIPVGKDNKYGHPRQIILDRLNAAHIPIFRTDQDGRIHRLLVEQHPP